MQVILLDKVVNLGNFGDIVKVRDGYARNFLIPQAKARRATQSALKEFEVRRAELEKLATDKLVVAQGMGSRLQGLVLPVKAKAGVDGRLFGSVTNADIGGELAKLGHSVEKSQIRIVNGLVKTIGEHPVSITLHSDVVVEIILNVVPESH